MSSGDSAGAPCNVVGMLSRVQDLRAEARSLRKKADLKDEEADAMVAQAKGVAAA